ncbi:MAG: MFS transporter [Polyangiaceae bacterium]
MRQSVARPHATALGASYATNFAALAASSPFLAVYLTDVGFSPAITAQLLAVCLLVRVVVIAPWTFLADRTHASGAVLRVASAGALVTFALLLASPPRLVVALALLAFAAFRAPFGPLLDALMLRSARATGRPFGAVRALGTAGYAFGAIVTGALAARHGARAVLFVSVTFLAAALAAACAIGRADASPGVHGGAAARLLAFVQRPRLALLLAIALLQQLGLAPYDALFPAYLTKLAGAGAAGTAVALGAGCELVFMIAAPSLAGRIGPERLLTLACAASVARWSAVALTTSPAALILLQALHAFGFGAFYVAGVILVDAESPPGLRASAQGIFASLCFGVAPALGLSFAGLVELHAAIRGVFGVAAAGAVLAALLSMALRPATVAGSVGEEAFAGVSEPGENL